MAAHFGMVPQRKSQLLGGYINTVFCHYLNVREIGPEVMPYPIT